MTSIQPDGETNMLLLGVGNAGGRAAYYVFQRGSLPGLRICALDSEPEALKLLNGLNTVLLPKPAEDDHPEEIAEVPPDQTAQQHLHQTLDAHFPTIQLLLVVTGLGGRTGCYYTLEILRYAQKNSLSCAAVVALPHRFDSAAQHTRAEIGLQQLRAITPAVQLLPCAEFGHLFLHKAREEAYPQAARWLAESCLGFLHPFAKHKFTSRPPARSGRKDDPNQLTFIFSDQPRGIFTGGLPSNYYGQNLDLPTFQRLKIEIDDGK